VEASTKPAFVTLQGEMTLSQAMAAIEKQTGNKLVDHRAEMQQDTPDPKITLALDKVPFWTRWIRSSMVAELTTRRELPAAARGAPPPAWPWPAPRRAVTTRRIEDRIQRRPEGDLVERECDFWIRRVLLHLRPMIDELVPVCFSIAAIA